MVSKSDVCLVDFVSRSAVVKKNDLVITSGQGGIFPAGLKVGRVIKSQLLKTSAHQRVFIEPIIDYTQTPSSYGVVGADNVYILSHKSKIPNKTKINLDGTLYGISQDKFVDELFNQTSSSVRGEELLQLINVLRGDMSLVGPRPLLMQYLTRYNSEQAKRHNVKPGITGWAQVNGLRGATPNPDIMKQRMEFDLWYLNNWSILLDLYIILKTFYSIFKYKGD